MIPTITSIARRDYSALLETCYGFPYPGKQGLIILQSSSCIMLLLSNFSVSSTAFNKMPALRPNLLVVQNIPSRRTCPSLHIHRVINRTGPWYFSICSSLRVRILSNMASQPPIAMPLHKDNDTKRRAQGADSLICRSMTLTAPPPKR